MARPSRRATVDQVLPLVGGIWWVGKPGAGSSLPCHSFLLERGDQSVLFDPGNWLDPEELVRQIERIVPIDQVRWLVCHEPEPADVAALLALQRRIGRADAALVTHSLCEPAWAACGLPVPRWFVDQHEWNLDLGGRALRFVPTPFAPGPGTFCTFDAATGTLFSSGLFGVAEGGIGLIANDISRLDGLFLFHERHLPSREALRSSLERISELPLRSLAPHHGPMVPEHLVRPMLGALEDLECGLALRDGASTGALQQVNRLLRDLVHELERESNLSRQLGLLLEKLAPLLPAQEVEILVQGNRAQTLRLAGANNWVAEVVEPVAPEAGFLAAGTRARWHELHGPRSFQIRYYAEPLPGRAPGPSSDGAGRMHYLWLPLFSAADATLIGLARFTLSKPMSINRELDALLARLSSPLATSIEREVIHQTLRRQDDRYYQLVVRDPLTSLYTRRYFDVLGRQLLRRNQRGPAEGFAVVLLDLDHTGELNNALGVEEADRVFQAVARTIRTQTRAADVPVRFGGDEFLVFLHAASLEEVLVYVNRVREAIARLTLGPATPPGTLSFCAGIAVHWPGEALEALVRRADRALYRAKSGGRGRLMVAENPG
ncbi:MAG: diguanylate cyclase [Pseudomonadota bacterium]